MDEVVATKKFARRSNVIVYICMVVVSIAYSFLKNTDSDNMRTVRILYEIITTVWVWMYKKEKKMKYKSYAVIVCTLMYVECFLIGVSAKNTYMYFFVLLCVMCAGLLYADTDIYKFYVRGLALSIVLTGVFRYPGMSVVEDIWELVMFYLIFVLICVLGTSFASFLEFNAKSNMQQEESLDDLIKVVTAKCEEARNATKSKSQFLANMSHEIRTPINAVMGMDEMILRETKEKDIKKYAMDIKTATLSLLSIINDILDLSKIESGKMRIVPVEYDFSSLLNDLVNMTKVRMKGKELELEVNVAPDLPSFYYGDDIRIRQVLTNILTNAVKYTPSGKVTLTVTGEENGNLELLHFSIKDTGIGIKEEDLPKLFEQFERIDLERNRNIEGTGLGMNITVGLLKMMYSKLNVKSVYGEGTEFYFDLQQRIVNYEPIGSFEERVKKLSTEYTYDSTFTATDAKVLVVDDNDINRTVFRGLLKDTKIHIDDVDSGKKCLEKIQEEQYDIVFLDHMMPEMDGIETLREMKELENNKCKSTPIVMLTANAIVGAREQYLHEGFDEFLAKPIAPDKLEEMILCLLPTDKIVFKSKEEIEKNRKKVEDVQNKTELPEIDGVDWKYGLCRISDRDVLLQVAVDFYESIEREKEKLSEMIREIEDSDTLAGYRIQVHALKSTTAMIGVMSVSVLARLLEEAAKENNTELILKLNPILLDELEKCRIRMSCLEKKDKGKQSEKADEIWFMNILSELREAFKNRDFPKSDDLCEQLGKFTYGAEVQREVNIICDYAMNMDAQAGMSETEVLINKIQGGAKINEH